MASENEPDRLVLSFDVPPWISEDDAAEAIAAVIIQLNALHIALGGGGLVAEGLDGD